MTALSVPHKRMVKACCIVGLLVAMLPLGNAIAGQEQELAGQRLLSADELYEAVSSDAVDSLFASAGIRKTGLGAYAPEHPVVQAFAGSLKPREIWSVDGMRLAAAVCDGSASWVFDSISASLVQEGWSIVPSGSQTAGSFVRSDGPIRWAYVSCSQEGLVATAVIQWLEEDAA